MPRKIAILSHEKQDITAKPYLLRVLMDFWRKSGFEVVILKGAAGFEPADALLMHVDLTAVPSHYQEFAGRYPVVINRVTDISKRRFSENILASRNDYDGPVIVKTDRNCGGARERRLAWGQKGLPGLTARLKSRLPWTWSGEMKSDHYPIYTSPQEVPAMVWRNPRLVVEKFVPERAGNDFCLRQWVFFGRREMSQLTFSPDRIIKAGLVTRREYDIPVPESLRALRKNLGFDYGKFDFVMNEGKAVLLDANHTPSFNAKDPSPQLMAYIENLARGVEDFIDVKVPINKTGEDR